MTAIQKNYPYHLTKYEGKMTSKILIFKLFSELGESWKCSLCYSKIPTFYLVSDWKSLGSVHSQRPTLKNPNSE